MLPSVELFSLRSCRSSLSIGLAAILASTLSAQSAFKHWGTTYETQVGVGYDSNVYGLRDSYLNDGFWDASQSVKLERRNSLTSFDITGVIDHTDYFDQSDADYTDASVAISASYPDDKIDVTFWNASLFWNKETRLNLDAGKRVQPTVYGARFGGEWKLSPKTGFVGSFAANTSDLSSQGLSKTDSIKLRAGISRAWGAESRWSFEYRLSKGESDSAVSSKSTNHHLGFRGFGVLTPKLRGSFFAGLRKSEFTGFYNFSDSGPNVSADLTWSASPRFSAVLGLENDYQFTANGNVQLQTTANLRLRRDLGKGFRVSGVLERGLSDYELRDGDDGIEEDYWRLGAEFEYSFTKRFYTRLTMNSLASESSQPGRDTNRTLYRLFGGIRY